MDNTLLTGVWEITMGCNMRCKHCGSICEDKLPDELTTAEALALCDDLHALGLKNITISGGEPTLRDDWPLIAKRLTDHGIQTSMITNAWIFDETLLKKAVDAGLLAIAISIDGLRQTHDHIRRPGSFDKDIAALRMIKDSPVLPAVITTVNSANISELHEMHTLFREIGLHTWQLQLALPMGSLMHNTSFFLEPYHLNQLIDFAHDKMNDGIDLVMGDNVGYFSRKALEISMKLYPDGGYWEGCSAGKHTIGILHNGDITGCTSMRDREFIEGNIRERSVIDIWNSEASFAWNRQMKKTSLKGLCAKCRYDKCLGGCSNLRLCMNGDIYSENKFCSYHMEVDRVAQRLASINDVDKLRNNACSLASKGQFQSAELVLAKLLDMNPQDVEMKELYGYVHFELGNYELCARQNREVLRINPESAYATKGLGLALYRQGNVEDGLKHMYDAINMKNGSNAEIYYDLFAVLMSLQRIEEALQVKELAKSSTGYDIWHEQFESALASTATNVNKLTAISG